METMTMDTTMRMITGKMHGIDNKEMKGYRYMKRKMNFRQILALVCAIIIPVLYIITIILLIAGNPYGQLFLSNISWGNIFPYPYHVSGDKATKGYGRNLWQCIRCFKER